MLVVRGLNEDTTERLFFVFWGLSVVILLLVREGGGRGRGTFAGGSGSTIVVVGGQRERYIQSY
jgi:preprotein translocase subunit SecG